MGIFDSIYVNGEEYQTKSLDQPLMHSYEFPAYIAEIDPGEVRRLDCGIWVKNQVTYKVEDIALEIDPTDALREALKAKQEQAKEMKELQAKARAMAVALMLGETTEAAVLEEWVPKLADDIETCTTTGWKHLVGSWGGPQIPFDMLTGHRYHPQK